MRLNCLAPKLHAVLPTVPPPADQGAALTLSRLLLTPARGVPGAAAGAGAAHLAVFKALQGATLTAASMRRAAQLLHASVGRPAASACGGMVAHVLRGGLVLLQCAKAVARALFAPRGPWSLFKAVTLRSAAAALTAVGVPWAVARFVVKLAWDTSTAAITLCSGAQCCDTYLLPCCGVPTTLVLHVLQVASCPRSAKLKVLRHGLGTGSERS